MRRYLILILAVLIPVVSFAWGAKGHDIVACVAQQNVSKRTLRKVESVLGGHSMVYVANWMDNASHTEKYAYTKTWHYVNVDPEEGSYRNSMKETQGDVVVAVDSIIVNLKSGELTPDEERAQLMMLIHLVGDMHCPMHAGHKSDRGGNGTKVKYFGSHKKLHSVWDTDIIESAHRWSYAEWQEQIDRVSRRERRAMVQGAPADWIEECVTLAADVYAQSATGKNLSYDYVAYYAPVVEEQLLKAGLRLASILETIY